LIGILIRMYLDIKFIRNELEKKMNQNWAEPGATANEHACHGLCSEQHTPRQARSSLSLNVRQN
jgi:hypothetical protein